MNGGLSIVSVIFLESPENLSSVKVLRFSEAFPFHAKKFCLLPSCDRSVEQRVSTDIAQTGVNIKTYYADGHVDRRGHARRTSNSETAA